jgi:hypothetical protein
VSLTVASLMPPTGAAPKASSAPEGRLIESTGRPEVPRVPVGATPTLTPLGTSKLTRSATDADEGVGALGAAAAARAADGGSTGAAGVEDGAVVALGVTTVVTVFAGGTLGVLTTTGGALGVAGGEEGGGLTTTAVVGGFAGALVTG